MGPQLAQGAGSALAGGAETALASRRGVFKRFDAAERGLHHRHVTTLTTQFTGVFKTDDSLRQRFLDFANRQ